MDTKKLVLLGDSRVGKTTLVRRLLETDVDGSYQPTIGVEVEPVVIKHGSIKRRYNIWDMAGDPRYRGMGEDYLISAKIAVIMYDNPSLTSAIDWEAQVRRVCPEASIVKCVNHFHDVECSSSSSRFVNIRGSSDDESTNGIRNLREILSTL